MFAKKLSRREMAVWCAALALGCVLAGLSGFALDWGRAQLDTGAALCADSLQDQTAKLAVRDALLAYTDAQCRASTQPEALHWAAQNLPALELTARQTLARLGLAPAARVELVNMYFASTRRAVSGPAHRPGRQRPPRQKLVVRALPGPLPRGLRQLCPPAGE